MSSADAPPAFDTNWQRRVRIVEQFEERWQERGDADIAQFLPPGGRDRELLFELIKVDLEYRWSRGRGCRVEEYAGRFPELGEPSRVPIELIAEELRVRRLHGSAATIEELLGRFPDRRPEFDRLVTAERAASERVPAESPRPTGAAGRCDSSTSLAGAESATPTVGVGPGIPLAVESHSIGAGTTTRLGKYELLERIGSGGFATVYRARDPELRREVAIKLPRAELLGVAGSRERFVREAQTAARLRHPAIVAIHEVGQAGDTPFIVYEFVPGPTLTKLLRETNPSPQQTAEWVARLAEALEYAHQNGIVHRDVKPDNVMMDEYGRPMLADFGLALGADFGATLTQEGDLLGTPAYMSPEQARGEGHGVDARTDVYSLGVMLYEMLAGRRPFAGSGASVLQRVIDEEPPALRTVRPGVPLDLETICQRAMAKEASRRYTTAGALAADLRAWLEHRPIRARRVGALGRLARWCRRKPALAGTIAIAAVVTVAVTAAAFWRVVRERDRYLAERQQAVTNLYESLVGEARALRLARSNGYRAEAWKRLEQALHLNTPARDPLALRQEAVASMGDFVGLEPLAWNPRSQPNDYVVAVALPADRGQVALGLADGSVVLCDIATGNESGRMRSRGEGVFDVSYSPDGQTLYSADSCGLICAWQRQPSGEWAVTQSFTTSPSQRPNHVNAISIALTPDGRQLLACPFGAQSIDVWDLATGAAAEPFRLAEAEQFLSVTTSRDGRWLAAPFVGKGGDGVAVWELATRNVARLLYPGLGLVNRVVFSGDGRLLACACQEGAALFRTADFQAHLFVQGDSPYTVSFSPDDQWLAIPSPNRGVVRLWNVATNREVAVLRHEIGEGLNRSADEPHTAVFTADGSSLVTASANWVRVWNLRGSGDKIVLSGHHGTISDVAFHPGGRLLASAGNDRVVKLWEPSTGRFIRSLDRCDSQVLAIAFSPDGGTLATGEQVGSIWLWDIAPSGESHGRAALSHDLRTAVQALAFSPDGRYLAAGAEQGVQIWRAVPPSSSRRPGRQTGQDGSGEPSYVAAPDAARLDRRYEPLTRLPGRSVYGLCFSPDSTLLAWRDFDNQRHVWDVDGARPRDLPARTQNAGGMAFFPDGKRAVYVAGGEAEVWDIVRGQLADPLGLVEPAGEGNWYTGYKLALHPEGNLLALQFLNVPIWDVRQKRLLLKLPREPDVPTCLAWSPNGEQLAIGLNDGGLVVWNLRVVRNQLTEIGLGW